jgi:hypothetical protein
MHGQQNIKIHGTLTLGLLKTILTVSSLPAGRSGAQIPAPGPTQSPIQWVPGSLPGGIKQPGRDVGHTPPSSAEVKNEWS